MPKGKSCTHITKRFIKRLDIFGAPINLTYKKRTTYKSLLGGIVTLLSRIILFAYFVYQVK